MKQQELRRIIRKSILESREGEREALNNSIARNFEIELNEIKKDIEIILSNKNSYSYGQMKKISNLAFNFIENLERLDVL